MKAIGWCMPSACTWESTAPVAKLEASHSRQKQLDWEGKVRMGAEVTAFFRALNTSCSGEPQTHCWVPPPTPPPPPPTPPPPPPHLSSHPTTPTHPPPPPTPLPAPPPPPPPTPPPSPPTPASPPTP